MKLGVRKPNKIQESSKDFELKTGLSDELDEFAVAISDKSGTQVVKQNDVVRNLDYMNQKGSEVKKDVEHYDDQVAKQVKQSIEESVQRLKRKYLQIVEADCRTKQTEDQKFSYKRDPKITKPVFEEVKMPRRKKITKPSK